MSPRRFCSRRFQPAERLFVEPQAALTWAWVEGDDFRAGRSFTVHQDDYQSLIGRVGVRACLEFPNEKSTFYARVSGAWEMMGEDEYHAVADAGRVESFRTELDSGWSEYAVGANFSSHPTPSSGLTLKRSRAETSVKTTATPSAHAGYGKAPEGTVIP
ncbi:MAG: autotransporter domain-containing protein [Sutterella wadsworthensis]